MQGSLQDVQGSREQKDHALLRMLWQLGLILIVGSAIFVTLVIQLLATSGGPGSVMVGYMPQTVVLFALLNPALFSEGNVRQKAIDLGRWWLIAASVWIGSVLFSGAGLLALATQLRGPTASFHPYVEVTTHASLLSVMWVLATRSQLIGIRFLKYASVGVLGTAGVAGFAISTYSARDLRADLPWDALVSNFDLQTSGSPLELYATLTFEVSPISVDELQPIIEGYLLVGPVEDVSETGETVLVWEYRWHGEPPNLNFEHTRAELSDGTLKFSFRAYSGL